MKERFSGKAWVDVFSKADVLEDVFEEADAMFKQAASQQAQAASQPAEEVQDPVEVAVRLPGALRVSSLTKAGIRDLQGAIVDIFSVHMNAPPEDDGFQEEEEEEQNAHEGVVGPPSTVGVMGPPPSAMTYD